jgi:hypothetical protein
MDRSQKLLAALVAVFLLVLGYRLMNPFEQPTVDTLTHTGEKPVSGKIADGVPAPKAERDSDRLLETLYQVPQQSSPDVRRDPFTKLPEPKPAPEKPPQQQVSAPEPTVLTPEDRVREELRQFQVFGSFDGEKDRALFLQRGKQVILVRENDLIDGRYIVESFTDNTITVRGDDLEGPVMVALEELPGSSGGRLKPATATASVEEAPEPPPAFDEEEAPPVEEPPVEGEPQPPQEPSEDNPDGETPRNISGLKPSFPPKKE